jgi:hypothetical protein
MATVQPLDTPSANLPEGLIMSRETITTTEGILRYDLAR